MLRSRRSEKGQAIIELVLVLPLILVLIHLIVDFGLALDRRTVLQHALREASRQAAEGEEFATIAAVAVEESDDLLETSDVTVCYIDEGGASGVIDAGDTARVQLNYTYKFTIGSGEVLRLFNLSAPDIDLSPTAEAPLLNSPPGGVAVC